MSKEWNLVTVPSILQSEKVGVFQRWPDTIPEDQRLSCASVENTLG